MIEVKQYIIIRDDLNMSSGKIAAQACHASMKIFFDKFHTESNNIRSIYLTDEEIIWVDGIFTKIVKKVKSENELLKIYTKAKDAGLNVSLIKDIGLTELEGENYTAIAIGPNYISKCEPIVKRLRNL